MKDNALLKKHIWPGKNAPIIVAIYWTHKEKDAHNREAIASVTQILVNVLQ